MGMKMDINTGELIIDEKYVIKPLMTVEEIRNSNLKEIMDEDSRVWLEKRPSHPIFIRTMVDGEEVSIELDITKALIGINIKVDPLGVSECYHTDDEVRFSSIVRKNSNFRRELFRGSNNKYRFDWGRSEFNAVNRDYNVEIMIRYRRKEVI